MNSQPILISFTLKHIKMKKLVKKLIKNWMLNPTNFMGVSLLGVIVSLIWTTYDESSISNYVAGFFGIILSISSIFMLKEAKNAETKLAKHLILSTFTITALMPIFVITETWLKKIDLTLAPIGSWVFGGLVIWFVGTLLIFMGASLLEIRRTK